jgi:hypothetical protein
VVGNKVVYAAFFASGQGKQGIFKQGIVPVAGTCPGHPGFSAVMGRMRLSAKKVNTFSVHFLYYFRALKVLPCFTSTPKMMLPLKKSSGKTQGS